MPLPWSPSGADAMQSPHEKWEQDAVAKQWRRSDLPIVQLHCVSDDNLNVGHVSKGSFLGEVVARPASTSSAQERGITKCNPCCWALSVCAMSTTTLSAWVLISPQNFAAKLKCTQEHSFSLSSLCLTIAVVETRVLLFGLLLASSGCISCWPSVHQRCVFLWGGQGCRAFCQSGHRRPGSIWRHKNIPPPCRPAKNSSLESRLIRIHARILQKLLDILFFCWLSLRTPEKMTAAATWQRNPDLCKKDLRVDENGPEWVVGNRLWPSFRKPSHGVESWRTQISWLTISTTDMQLHR